MLKSKKGECTYCGEYGPITKDHIPPKNLFSFPRPNNLISIPSCLKCNNSSSKDDEYFRNALTMRYDTYEHPDANKNWDVVIRSFSRKESIRFTKSIFKNMQDVDLFTTSGIFIGKSGMVQIDINRLLKTVNRIIKGLFFYEYGSRLPNDYKVRSFSLERITINTEILNLISVIKNVEPKTIGKNVFKYWLRQTEEDPFTTMCLILFYEKVAFVGITHNVS